MSETSTIVRPLLEALRKRGIACHRIHCGKVRVRGGWMHLNPEGKPDIGGHLPGGRAFYVEAKGSHTDACKCTHCAAQRQERERIEQDQALYVFARSVEEALRGLGIA